MFLCSCAPHTYLTCTPRTIPWDDVVLTAHYTGRLLDGTKFDSSVDRGQVFKVGCAVSSSHSSHSRLPPPLGQFPLGRGRVIKGWDLGFATMRVGEVRFVCGR